MWFHLGEIAYLEQFKEQWKEYLVERIYSSRICLSGKRTRFFFDISIRWLFQLAADGL